MIIMIMIIIIAPLVESRLLESELPGTRKGHNDQGQELETFSEP